MASINDSIVLNISRNTAAPSRPGFGTPLVAAYHTKYADRVRAYTDPSGLITDGFTVNDAAYKAVSSAFAQNPKPIQVKVGRRALPPTQVVTLTPSIGTSDVQSGVIVAPSGLSYPWTYTVTVGQTLAQVCTAVAAAITALAIPAFTAVASSTLVTCTGTTPGQLFDYQSLSANVAIQNITTDPGIATDLAAIVLADNDWYGLALDSNSKAEVTAAAAWVEPLIKTCIPQTQDSDTGTSSTTDALSALKGSSYTRTLPVYHRAGQLSNIGMAILGKLLPQDPGTAVAAYKNLAGIAADNLSATFQNNVRAKNGNDYQIAVNPIAVLQTGTMASGDYLDIIIGIDWFTVNAKIDVYTVLLNNPKLPFTDSGAEVLRSTLEARCRVAESLGIFTPGSSVVTVPKVSTMLVADKAARRLRGLTFSAQLAGAIQSVTISGTLSL